MNGFHWLRHRPVWVTALLLLGWAGYSAWSAFAADRKLTDDEIGERESIHIEIVLGFEPEAFHITRFQELGRLIKVEGQSAFMMDVPVEEARALAGRYWVRDIAIWPGLQG
ncbi:MAG: hypothetical protein AAF637_20975 [Pseudomonadota bacterium]